ncbi:hypothetical protein HWC08_gp180 [Lactobacillus phage 521B]|uniref:Uncharacterized protein n=1 Tax=Lactobacillus phage 521B TaxID=2510942 RepID=A0A4Y5FEH9_9CAUD|nr:hypothetical protein HWC08_gp180 [Lactobacillus phage 521B]QBJ03461.1 hypothetical protein B521_0111 [Lactobacillus phage 521B]
MITISFKKNSKGTYDFSVIQNSKILYRKEYTCASQPDETGITQVQVFSGYTKYLQDLVDKEIEKNPDFKWNSFADFKKFAGAKTQHKFWENESKYITPATI